MRKYSAQSGAVLPLLILGVLVVGILVATKLVTVPQLFKSKAASNEVKFVGTGVKLEGNSYVTQSPTVDIELTSPYGLQSSGNPTTNAQPIFEDDFNNPNNPKLGKGSYVSNQSTLGTTNYVGGTYEVFIPAGGDWGDVKVPHHSAGYKDVGANEYTAVFDAKLSGEGDGDYRSIGVIFSGTGTSCNSGSYPCYILTIWDDGQVNLNNKSNSDRNEPNQVYERQSKLTILNKQIKMRLDKKLDHIKLWIEIESDHWIQVADTEIDKNRTGKSFGFVIMASSVGNYSVRGNFDNLKIYRLGDLPEPTRGGYYRYAGDPNSINNDPDGNAVKWAAYTAHPFKRTLHVPLNPGVNVLYVQFKSASGEKSQVFQSSIELKSGSPTSSPTPALNGKPSFTTASVCVNQDNVIEVRGAGFGTTGTVYYSRGGSHEVVARQIKEWSDSLVKLGKGIDDPASPVPNSITGGQYLRVCRSSPYACSDYVVLPSENFYSGSCNK